ncbi:MAG: hypothetical protein JSW12_04195, partial [Deltaproteobacteria bacterium]
FSFSCVVLVSDKILFFRGSSVGKSHVCVNDDHLRDVLIKKLNKSEKMRGESFPLVRLPFSGGKNINYTWHTEKYRAIFLEC